MMETLQWLFLSCVFGLLLIKNWEIYSLESRVDKLENQIKAMKQDLTTLPR